MNCLRTVVQVSNSLRETSKQHLELPAYKAKASTVQQYCSIAMPYILYVCQRSQV